MVSTVWSCESVVLGGAAAGWWSMSGSHLQTDAHPAQAAAAADGRGASGGQVTVNFRTSVRKGRKEGGREEGKREGEREMLK